MTQKATTNNPHALQRTTRRSVAAGLVASAGLAACKVDDISGGDALASPAAAAIPTPAATPAPAPPSLPPSSASSGAPFAAELLSKPGIAAPQDPFVNIFHIPARRGAYPFVTGAPMTRDDYANVYRHIGHLSPYELMILADVRDTLWNITDKVPFEVAQQLGRPTGGGFYSIPSGAGEDTARRLYRDPIGLNVTHWMHDNEQENRDAAWLQRMKIWYVDELLAARRAAGKTPPAFITNWETNNSRYNAAVGGIPAFRSIGFTGGNWQYYSYRTDSGADVLQDIFVARPKFLLERLGHALTNAFDDQWKFGGSYIGIASDNGTPTPLPADEWLSLITLGTLEGMRHYFVFTQMSFGTLAHNSVSVRDKAIFNANALYAMAKAASRFESTKSKFRDSVYTEDAPLLDKSGNVLLRSRRNDNELWFAGVAFSGSASVRVQMPAASGTLTNLATGARAQVSGGAATVQLSRITDLYHFRA